MFRHVLAGLSHDGKMRAQRSAPRAPSDASCSPELRKDKTLIYDTGNSDAEGISPPLLGITSLKVLSCDRETELQRYQPSGHGIVLVCNTAHALGCVLAHLRTRRCHRMEEGKKFPSKEPRAHFLFLPFLWQ